MQNILINLNTISKIKAYDKIYIDNEDFISIENDNIFQGVVRFFYNISRTKNVKNLNNFYMRVFDHVSILINKISHNKYHNIKNNDYLKQEDVKINKNMKNNKNNNNILDNNILDKNDIIYNNDYNNLNTANTINNIYNEYIDDKNNLIKLKNYLRASVVGLDNLKLTYSSDILTNSKIDIIINLIETYNNKIDNLLNIV